MTTTEYGYTIDHVDESRACLEVAAATGSEAAASAAIAHATLALVEQQRIANLISYKQLHTAREMSQTERGWHLDDLDVARDNLTDEIEAGLGLDQGVTKP